MFLAVVVCLVVAKGYFGEHDLGISGIRRVVDVGGGVAGRGAGINIPPPPLLRCIIGPFN